MAHAPQYHNAKANWYFSTAARVKLKSLSPSL